jgi:hypothetical protein
LTTVQKPDWQQMSLTQLNVRGSLGRCLPDLYFRFKINVLCNTEVVGKN